MKCPSSTVWIGGRYTLGKEEMSVSCPKAQMVGLAGAHG